MRPVALARLMNGGATRAAACQQVGDVACFVTSNVSAMLVGCSDVRLTDSKRERERRIEGERERVLPREHKEE